jgi:CheY-like chemotaxis protein
MSKLILVIEDDADHGTILEMILESSGHRVIRAGDGPEGLEMAERNAPDVVLLDISLPTMDGYEVCRRLRTEPWGNKALIVIMTGWSDESNRELAFAAGCDRHLSKPFEPAELLTVVGKERQSE